MAWELASFPSERMGPVPELEGVEVNVVHGGEPVADFALHLPTEDWTRLVGAFLLT